MARRQAALILAIVRTDSTFERMDVRGESMWVGRCIHCNTRMAVSLRGDTDATIEHIEPTTHGGTSEVNNVALACPRCNHRKGARLDNRRRDDPTLSQVIDMLKARRKERWREDSEVPQAPSARSGRASKRRQTR
jgi:hypothetical protein